MAYCILAHKDPPQVRRLIDRIFDSEDMFYINIFSTHLTDPKLEWEKAFAPYQGENFFMERNYSNAWGSFQLVQATLDAMEHFRVSDYDYFLNLSGQCYPLKPVNEIKDDLSKDPDLGFIECEAFPRERWVEERGGYRRIDHRWYKPFKYMKKVSIPRLRKELPMGMKAYGGSQWFCLTKRQVDYVLEFIRLNPEVVRFFERALIPDEIFFQTILMNSPISDTVDAGEDKRFIDWQKKSVPLPAILLTEDTERLIRSDKLFARKFDPVMDSNVLDRIDEHIRAKQDDRFQGSIKGARDLDSSQ